MNANSGGVSKILCCLCGASIVPNDVAMCLECLRSQVDITDVISKSCEITQCKKCERWHTGKDHWTNHEMESSSLLACCLKMIPGIQKATLIDAKWVWTEPHSKRLKIMVTIERSVLNDKINLRQSAVVEFVIKNKQCLPCIREATDHTWGALVQLRQKVGHKRSLYSLESTMVKAGLHATMINITQTRDGLDMYFRSRNTAEKVVEFISSKIPTKTKMSQKLVSQDLNSNTSKVEFTIHAEVAPLCKGDLVVTDKALTGGSELMIVTKLTNGIYLLNPLTMHSVIVSSARYFMKPFTPLLTMNHLINFVVIDINPVAVNRSQSRATSSESESWFEFAETQVCRESDLGENDTVFTVMTHLGRILQVGDTVLGYDLQHTLMDDSQLESLSYDHPDVILIRKSYPEEKKPRKSKNSSKKSAAAAQAEGSAIEFAVEGVDLLSNDINEDALEQFNAQLLDEAALLEELRALGHEASDDALVDPQGVLLSVEDDAEGDDSEGVAASEST